MPSPNSVTVKVDRSRAASLRDELEAAGWTLDKVPPYAKWALRGPGAKAVLYNSGKFLLQGKGAADAAATFLDHDAGAASRLERVTMPTVGSDESGKGDFLGPLTVAAVLVRPGQEEVLETLGIRDSKAMADKEATEAAAILKDAYPSAVVSIGPERYNAMHADMGSNLNRVLAWAHGKAIETVLEREDASDAAGLVVDQFAKGTVVKRALGPLGRDLPLDERPRAESHPAVAAASVLAREAYLSALDRLGHDIGVPLRKGAGSPADQAARKVVARGGRDLLARVAKMHFKNTGKVLP
ncbi:MAG: ribonuclease HIII [Planctomycetota bacterium]|jgi:ribonuclease HIII